MKTRNYLSLTFNFIIVVFTILALCIIFRNGAEGNMEGEGFGAFKYFTILSNVFVGLVALIMIFFNIKGKVPKCILTLKLISTISVTVTLLTVVFLLSSMYGMKAMLMGANLYMHLLTPIVAILSYIFFDLGRLRFRANFISIIPTLTYGLVYLTNVIITKIWVDFYGFNSGILEGKWIFSFIFMQVFSFILSVLINGAHNLLNKDK